jgi:hypothetical protein
MQNIFYLKSSKQADLLVIDYFVLIKNKIEIDCKIYWKCSTYNCPVTAKTLGQDLVGLLMGLNYSDYRDKVISIQLRYIMKSFVLSQPYRSAQDIYDEAKQTLDERYIWSFSIARLLPSFDSVKSNIYRWKSQERPSGRMFDAESFDFDFFIQIMVSTCLFMLNLEVI